MKELDPLVFVVVFQEMLGAWLWIMLAVGVLGAVALVLLLLRERSIVSRRLVASEVVGFFGGWVALVIMATVSSSGFTDAGGPADWFLIAIVYGVGLVVTTLLVYTAIGWLGGRTRVSRDPAVL